MKLFKDSNIKVVPLARWLDWAAGRDNEVFVSLPMIQRNLVWQPHQLIELWDSLLQGMPIGSLLVSELPAGTSVRQLLTNKRTALPENGGLAVLDGQQRTLAMLVAWPRPQAMDQRLWVDFLDEPTPGQLLRLRVTAKNQRFGFQRSEPSRKLSLDDRRKAREAMEKLGGDLTVDHRPFSMDMGLPIDLQVLVEEWLDIKDCDGWIKAIEERLRSIPRSPISE